MQGLNYTNSLRKKLIAIFRSNGFYVRLSEAVVYLFTIFPLYGLSFQKFLQLEEISFKQLCIKKDASAIKIDSISAKWDEVHLQLFTDIDLRRVQQWERFVRFLF